MAWSAGWTYAHAMTPAVRGPAVAGRFYPAEPSRLAAIVESCLGAPVEPPIPARMVMAPHAGYVYSGGIAGTTYARVQVPESAIVLCPNHTGLGTRRALWMGGAWRLPGFDVEVDHELASLARDYADLNDDPSAHLREHAIEVHLPFLHARRSDVTVVPICLGGLGWNECRNLGEGLARAIREIENQRSGRVLLVASTDMSHYISADQARELDSHALERVLALDPEGLHRVVVREDISMCGFIPTTVALVAAKMLGAERAELVQYGNSGEVSGDFDQVVGYAGVVVS
jgi:AmmeMemoRadiSam system protein B